MSGKIYRDYFNIDPKYYAAVTADLIESGKVSWKNFYPHETFVKLLEKTHTVLSGKDPRSLWVEGAYGTGKSHAALTVKSLLEATDEEVEEYRVIEELRPAGHEEEDFDMAEKDDHEPSKGYAGVHIAQHLVAFPKFDVQQAVEEDILDILPGCRWRYEGLEELAPVLPRKLDEYADDAIHTVSQHEYHSCKERQNERMESTAETIYYHSTPSTLS